MKIPFEWLSEFVDLNNLSPQALAEELSLKAFEVEDIEFIGAQIQSPLVAGKILEINKHPNADKLQVTKTQVAPNVEPKQIVCGAKNIAVGQIVPVALPGALVTNRTNGEALAIKESKIRDVFSQGMLCSSSELGLEGDEGILILNPEIELGTNLIEELKLKPQAVLNVASRSNRGDALCLQGIARETAATLNTNLKIDYYKQNYKDKFQSLISGLAQFKSRIAILTLAKKMAFLKITNIKLGLSPDWMIEKLKLAGISSKNNIVDITNYVMLELGQPMHAYDASKLNLNEEIQVTEQAVAGAQFKTLDKQEILLNSSALVIKNAGAEVCLPQADTEVCLPQAAKILALAGVMGGLESAINENTTEIVLEAACFTPQFVRRSSRSTGISTESSRRFERGTDPELVEIALLRAAELIQELADGKVEAYSLAEGSDYKKQITSLNLNLKDFEKLVGLSIKASEAKIILEKLGFEIEIENEQIIAKVPSYRQADIQRPIDLIEELARFMGLNKIEPLPLPGISKLLEVDAFIKPEGSELVRSEANKIKSFLIAQGYFETVSSSLVSESQNPNTIKMKNPLSKDYAELRLNLFEGLLKSVSLNTRRQQNQIRLFELGKIYEKLPSKQIQDYKRETNTKEITKLGLILSSKAAKADWQSNIHASSDFYELKGLIQNLCTRKGKLNFTEANEEFLHPRISASVKLNGKTIGFVGQIYPSLADKFEIPKNTFIAELLLEPLLSEPKFKLKELNDNPILQRDFTIDFTKDASISHQAINELIQKSKLGNLQEVTLLNLYKKDAQISLSYRLIFQAQNENLSSDSINQQIEELKKTMKNKFSQVSFRE